MRLGERHNVVVVGVAEPERAANARQAAEEVEFAEELEDRDPAAYRLSGPGTNQRDGPGIAVERPGSGAHQREVFMPDHTWSNLYVDGRLQDCQRIQLHTFCSCAGGDAAAEADPHGANPVRAPAEPCYRNLNILQHIGKVERPPVIAVAVEVDRTDRKSPFN